MTYKQKMADHKAKLDAKVKQFSKDVVVTAGKPNEKGLTSEDREARAIYFRAIASGDKSQIRKSNEVQVKQYEEKQIEWRNDAELKTKAQTVGTSSQGGALVPVTLRSEVIQHLYYVSPIRQIATVINNMPAALDMPEDNALPTTYWVGEGVAVTESGATFQKKQLVPYKLAGLDSFTSEVLADAAINPDLQSLIVNRFGTSMALAENAAFVSGDGSSKPYGFRSSDITPTTITGNTTVGNLAFGDILRLFYGLSTAYRSMGSFVTSSTGLMLIQSMKDSNGRPIYYQDLTGQGGDTFYGRPIKVVDEIPTNLGAGTNETELWYGLFSNYWIGNRGDLRTDYGTNGTDFAQDKISLRIIERVAGRPFLNAAWAKMNIK